ncbi:DUF2059 domain-containing protein [Aetokthonos hydrillicola Thurmond2011]|jgi:hypothetical protein|uniref:DUF2059 domain-containing protein n=1 Tax=Aetokthonos hydrillicola Thurmond2011 TaxID=2712845 RepID=A0AAP5M8P9_9CYAN|nr:DUF2059 domain-containing protein [Aetokthonos hydrillicola]MBO3463605.1 DUF2059 domain-containing protein [Aetokthonos hydrillicola CCALA 1050]MBW4586576.1 DUF2059 domain-containing protein [Aetokthonos hydrillicola CCALA 1050]MDR9893479.1 DUF2059 domain-containing protein [Aetokthonos hydrillicola Thurmond2011]
MNIKIFVSALLLSLLTTCYGAAFAQTSSGINTQPNAQETQKINNIKELLRITGASSLSQQIVTQLFMSLKSQYPQVPQKFWDTFLAEFKPDDLLNELIPIYSKYYSNEDINQLIAFYQSPIGKKTIAVLPQLTQESVLIGQRYGLEAGKRAIQKLEEEGYLRPQQK